jgi:general secretion pathway protein J
MQTRDRQGGFALIESIAVLALSGLVLLTLLIAADLVTRNTAAAARRTNDIEAVATGLSAVRRDLGKVRNVRAGSKADGTLLFQGNAETIRVAVGDDGSDLGGEAMLQIDADYETGRGVLVRSSAPLLPGSDGFGSARFGTPTAVLSGPWTYRFSYAGSGVGPLQWSGTWTNPAELPQAVRLELFDAAGARRILPPLVVALPIDATKPCLPSGDSGEGGCPTDAQQATDDRQGSEEQEGVPDEPGGG